MAWSKFLIIWLFGAMPFLVTAVHGTTHYVECDVNNPYLDCDEDGTPNGQDEHPLDPCIGGTMLLGSNDCDGDGLSVADGDPDDFDYCKPIEYPECSTVSTHYDDISQIEIVSPCQNVNNCYILLSVKVLLQGAYDKGNPQWMHDKLRLQNLIPLVEPYPYLLGSDGKTTLFSKVADGVATTTEAVLNTEGTNAIVDWVFIELRDKINPSKVIATKSALLQRDGDVVDVDGVSILKMEVAPSNYFIAVKHRNHLGVMTKFPIPLFQESYNTINFTSRNTPLYQLKDTRKTSQFPQKQIEETLYLWGGNVNADQYIVYQGPNLEQAKIFHDIFTHPENIGSDGFPNYNFILRGYHLGDGNMDGELQYQGPNNDIDELQFFNVILHPENPSFFTNKIIYEQIPNEA